MPRRRMSLAELSREAGWKILKFQPMSAQTLRERDLLLRYSARYDESLRRSKKPRVGKTPCPKCKSLEWIPVAGGPRACAKCGHRL